MCCLFCCGGLPILALLKAALTFPFCFVITVVGNTLLTLLYLPKNVLHSGRTIVQTPCWGMKLKFLFLLFLPIAALAPLPMVLLGSILYGLGNPVLVSFASTIAPEEFKNEFLCTAPIVHALESFQEYHEFCSVGCYNYLERLRNPENPDEIVPRDIPCGRLMVLVFQTTVIMVVFFVFNAVMVAIKLPLLLVGGYLYGLTQGVRIFCKEMSIANFFFSILFVPITLVLAIALWPVGLVLGAGAALSGIPLVLALDCAIDGYKYNSVAAGFVAMVNHMHDIDGTTNGAIVLFCCHCCDGIDYIFRDIEGKTCIKKMYPKQYPTGRRGRREGDVEMGNVGNSQTGEAKESGGGGGDSGAVRSNFDSSSMATGVSKDPKDPKGRSSQGAERARKDGVKEVMAEEGGAKVEEEEEGAKVEEEEGEGLVSQAVVGIGQVVSVVGRGLWDVASWGVSQVFTSGEEIEEERNGDA